MQQTIKDIADIQIGYQFRKKLEPVIDGTLKVIQIRDFDENQELNQEGLCRVTIDQLSEKYLVHKNDILFLARGHRNFATPVINSIEGTIAASHFFILKIKDEKVIPEYLAWFINQAPAQGYLHNLARRGTHMPIIPKSVFVNLKVHIPDIETQKKIVKLSTLIDKERTLLYNLREKRALLVRSLCLKAAKENV
ncbi:MAG: restriction endonuclease subunit S [Candidatus Brocadiaceae bacterium]|nr:restriction endonuclease subunit S [Candidatus Brocadiaceae bacterium]